jgi:NADPH2:quinone reductase
MRAIVFDEFGGADKLKLTEVPDPVAGPGEVLIRVVASGVNPVDWKIREGHLKGGFPHVLPIIPGWDVAGVVEAVGEGVSRLRVGHRVWAYGRKAVIQMGAYAEYIVLPQTSVALMPRGLLFHEAAGVPLAGLTAYQCLFGEPKLTSGQTALIHAASGGVGSLAVQLAKSVGARVIATAGPSNLEFVRELGADHVIDYRAQDLVAAVRSHSPAGVDLVLDSVGGDVQVQSLALLRPGGHLVSISSTPKAELLQRHGVTGRFLFVSPSVEQLDAISALVEAGRFRVEITRLYPLAAAAAAQAESQTGHTRGKIILVL